MQSWTNRPSGGDCLVECSVVHAIGIFKIRITDTEAIVDHLPMHGLRIIGHDSFDHQGAPRTQL